MKVKFLGHAAFLITSDKGTKIITDPYEPGGFGGAIGYGKITEAADIAVVSHDHGDHGYVAGLSGNPEIVKKSGSQEAKGIAFKGVPVYHDASKGGERGSNIMFCFDVDGVRVCHAGDLGHPLSAEEIAELGPIDVLMLPVGGFFTIDAAVASDIVNALKPRIVIPMHYKTEKCGFPIAGVDQFLAGKSNVKNTNASEVEISKGQLPVSTEIVVLKPAL